MPVVKLAREDQEIDHLEEAVTEHIENDLKHWNLNFQSDDVLAKETVTRQNLKKNKRNNMHSFFFQIKNSQWQIQHHSPI